MRSLFFAMVAMLALPIAVLAEAPNVVFILADDLGYTDLACYGSKYYETPNIDRLVEQGVKFTSNYTCGPNCQPTRAALITGQYGPRTGIYTVGSTTRFDTSSRPLVPVENVERLPDDKATVAESLRKAGYKTALFGKWHLGKHPIQRGFDEAIVTQGDHFAFKTIPKRDIPEGTYLADYLTDSALDFIERKKDDTFFLCLHHYGVHAPYQAKDDVIEKFRAKPTFAGHRDPVYAAMIASVDESVGRVLAKLDELKLSEKTLVIFTSDNGGVGGYTAPGKRTSSITSNAPLRSGKGSLYEGGIRVPYIARWPGTIKAQSTCEAAICSIDLHPTLLDLAGAEGPADQPLDGESIVPLLKQPTEGKLQREAIYWHFPGYLSGANNTWRATPSSVIRQGDWKLHEFFEDGHLELYNLKDDLSEKKNLAQDMPEKAQELQRKLAAWRSEVKAPLPQRREEIKAPQPEPQE